MNTNFQIQPANVRFVQMMIYFVAMMTQLVMYCWFGNEIMSSATKDACYEFEWFDSDLKTRKFLILIMERSKRPLFLTAGKFSVLSLQSFTSVIRTSYSYFALLQTLYRKYEK
ncbi:hypothetical protein JTB14_005358 [Gonioctena quinquepunctata]|nr:hypothetical protein JTB14_005358 [Gonioctena quinquepunctata]